MEAFLDEIYCTGLNTGMYVAKLGESEAYDILEENPFALEWLKDDAEPAVLPSNSADVNRECLKAYVLSAFSVAGIDPAEMD